MTQSNFEKNGGTYTQVGDYLIPDLVLPPEEQHIHLGVWGGGCPVDTSAKGRSTDRAGRRDMRYKRYLMQNKKAIFNVMIANGTLWKHLSEIDKQAEEMFNQLVKQMAEAEGITEHLKAENQILWVQKMNDIRIRATEIVNTELIYA